MKKINTLKDFSKGVHELSDATAVALNLIEKEKQGSQSKIDELTERTLDLVHTKINELSWSSFQICKLGLTEDFIQLLQDNVDDEAYDCLEEIKTELSQCEENIQ